MRHAILLAALALCACMPPTTPVWGEGPENPVQIRACAAPDSPPATPRRLLLAAVAALTTQGYPIHAVDAAAGVVVTGYGSPRGFPISWTVRIDPGLEATIKPSRGSPRFSGRALRTAEREARGLAHFVSVYSCEPTAALEALAARAGVELPPESR